MFTGIGGSTIWLIYNNSILYSLNTSISILDLEKKKQINQNILYSYYIIASCLGIIFLILLKSSTSLKFSEDGKNYETIACVILFFVIYLGTLGTIMYMVASFAAKPAKDCTLLPSN